MSEVNDELKRLVVERLECQKNMVDQEVTIDIQNSDKTTNQITSNHLCSTFTIYTLYNQQQELTHLEYTTSELVSKSVKITEAVTIAPGNDAGAGTDMSLVRVKMSVVSDPMSGVKWAAGSTLSVHWQQSPYNWQYCWPDTQHQ